MIKDYKKLIVLLISFCYILFCILYLITSLHHVLSSSPTCLKFNHSNPKWIKVLSGEYSFLKIKSERDNKNCIDCGKVSNIQHENLIGSKNFKLMKKFHEFLIQNFGRSHKIAIRPERHQQMNIKYMLAQEIWIQNVCEFGFSTGHSSLHWLIAKDYLRVFSLAFKQIKNSFIIANYLKEIFPNRIIIRKGNPSSVLENFPKTLMKTCDLIYINGKSLDFIQTNIFENLPFIASKRNIIFFDDPPTHFFLSGNLLYKWREFVFKNKIDEYFQCLLKNDQTHGYIIGSFIIKV